MLQISIDAQEVDIAIKNHLKTLIVGIEDKHIVCNIVGGRGKGRADIEIYSEGEFKPEAIAETPVKPIVEEPVVEEETKEAIAQAAKMSEALDVAEEVDFAKSVEPKQVEPTVVDEPVKPISTAPVNPFKQKG